MAAAAGLGDVPGENLRFGKVRRLDAVDSVAVGANGPARIPFLQELAVPARPVKSQLVHPQVGVEFPHGGRVGVAGAAETRGLGSFRRAPEGPGPGQPETVLFWGS